MTTAFKTEEDIIIAKLRRPSKVPTSEFVTSVSSYRLREQRLINRLGSLVAEAAHYVGILLLPLVCNSCDLR